MKINPISLCYAKQFDGLRAVAVLMVIVSHWFPNLSINKIGLGAIGVDIFFVLSGFLITRILIVEKIKHENNPLKYSKLKAIKNFTIRRSLRIFPIYFALLFLLILFNNFLPNPVAQDWPWYFLYLQNILFYLNQSWPGGKLSHLWSLAVEEQYYLIWPWVILFISRKWLLTAISFSSIVGIVSINLLPFYTGNKFTELLTVTCMQSFAAGGILAYFQLYKRDFLIRNKFYVLIPSLLISIYLALSLLGVISYIFDLRTTISISVVGLLTTIIVKPNIFLSPMSLGNPILVSIGRISYGLYLFHNFIPLILNSFLHLIAKKNIKLPFLAYVYDYNNQNLIFFTVSFTLLIIISFTSFYFFELPIKNWKNNFIKVS